LEFNDNTIKYCDFLGIRFKSIDSINEVIFNDILLYNPDTVILVDAPIISKKCVNMLNDAKIKIFNMHAADLPKYRGNYATHAMVRDNLPLVITLHTIDEKIDKGIVIDKFKLEK
jgi:formyl transferase